MSNGGWILGQTLNGCTYMQSAQGTHGIGHVVEYNIARTLKQTVSRSPDSEPVTLGGLVTVTSTFTPKLLCAIAAMLRALSLGDDHAMTFAMR